MPEISDEELTKLKADQQRALDLEASKKRLEDENSKIKSRAKEAEVKLSDVEKAKLEAEGNTQALLEKERAEKVSLQDRLKKSNETTMREKLRTEVSKYAKDAHDIDMILKVTDHKDVLKINSEELSVDGVKDYVEKVRETHGYLFSKKHLNNGDKRPPNDKIGDEFKTEDEKYVSELKACSTRQQMNDIRKKYGKPID